MTDQLAMALALGVPAVGALGIVAGGRWPNLRETVTLVTAAVLFATVLSLWPSVSAGQRPEWVIADVMPGLPLALRAEPLGLLFALVASGLWIVNSLYSIGYMRGNGESDQTRFYACFALALAATMGVALAANLFTLFVFYELLTLVTWPLVTHHGTPEARRGGRVYLGILMGSSILLLLPLLVGVWHLAGTTDFRPGGVLAGRVDASAAPWLLALAAFGIGKAALMPVHRWLPAAMVAPTPVSALLHAVAVVKAGVFCIVKIAAYTFGPEVLSQAGAHEWLAALAAFAIVSASVVALRSDNLKRRLAYSTVGQLSYVTLATALLVPASWTGAALHIAAHAVGKITLFFAAGAIYTAAHKTEVSQLDGIGRRMPWTMGAFAIGALSMIGLPPAAGFVSKWSILSGAVAAQHWLAVAALSLSTLLSAAYLLPIVYRAFLKAPAPGSVAHGEAPWPCVVALSLTAATTVLLFVFPDGALALARAIPGAS